MLIDKGKGMGQLQYLDMGGAADCFKNNRKPKTQKGNRVEMCVCVCV